jgi:predicted nucleotidyltransferase
MQYNLNKFGTFSKRIGIPAARKTSKKKLKGLSVASPISDLSHSAMLEAKRATDICVYNAAVTNGTRFQYKRDSDIDVSKPDSAANYYVNLHMDTRYFNNRKRIVERNIELFIKKGFYLSFLNNVSTEVSILEIIRTARRVNFIL